MFHREGKRKIGVSAAACYDIVQNSKKTPEIYVSIKRIPKVFFGLVYGESNSSISRYRQKPIGKFIVDFYAPAARLVIEVDGSQHLQGDHLRQDTRRDKYMASLGLTVLRFLDNEVIKDMDAVLESIYKAIEEQKTKMFQDPV